VERAIKHTHTHTHTQRCGQAADLVHWNTALEKRKCEERVFKKYLFQAYIPGGRI
jgi:hypothetical protein